MICRKKTKSACLKKFYETFVEIDELNIPSMDAAQRLSFQFLGLTDSALALVSINFLNRDRRCADSSKKMNESGLKLPQTSTHLRMYHLLSA